ncbi:hypothetical protein [Streptomyces griseocarneus]|uniref:hypothetical protein n=1 Tax=Streptomyces griseocarneus TaxID=51201 RepID=UPI00167DA781|nr:hypothetical protein [Streptomyces griseocarneus]MBZ6475986.1 hypothetical protein [Streptomyces griseocarneus]GHG49709.1 hypothetical protein GCM10018779_09040 [Streptomyces griseocarneus]
MSPQPRRPAPGLPAAEWWAPLLVDLAALQRAGTRHGLCARAVDLSSGECAAVTVHWPGRPAVTFLPDPVAGREALRLLISGAGPVDAVPAEHDTEFWAPDTPLLSHAWLLDELGRRSDAWYAYLPEPVELLRVDTDGHTVADVAVARISREDVVKVRVPLPGLGSDGTDAGLSYTVVENALRADTATLPRAEPVCGRPAFVSALPA